MDSRDRKMRMAGVLSALAQDEADYGDYSPDAVDAQYNLMDYDPGYVNDTYGSSTLTTLPATATPPYVPSTSFNFTSFITSAANALTNATKKPQPKKAMPSWLPIAAIGIGVLLLTR